MAVVSAGVAAKARAQAGLAPDPASDAIWAERLSSGGYTMEQMTSALAAKAQAQGVSAPSPAPSTGGGGGTASEPYVGYTGDQQAIAAGDAAIKARIEAIAANRGVEWTAAEIAGYVEAVKNNSMTFNQLRGTGVTQAEQQAKAKANAAQTLQLVVSSIGLPKALMDIFQSEYQRSGDVNLALAAVRQSPQYDIYYPGNRRADGTVKYTEAEYASVKDSMLDTLDDFGVNTALFEPKIGDLIAGDVSPSEFSARVGALYEMFGKRLNDEVSGEQFRSEFAAEFGIDPSQVTLSAVLGVAMDPGIGQEVLERRLSIASVSAQSSRYGYSRSRSRVEALLNAGLTADQAGRFYNEASSKLPRLSGQAARFNEGEFGVSDFEDAFALGDTADQQRVDRFQQRERSLFSQAGGVRRGEDGDLTGLRSR